MADALYDPSDEPEPLPTPPNPYPHFPRLRPDECIHTLLAVLATPKPTDWAEAIHAAYAVAGYLTGRWVRSCNSAETGHFVKLTLRLTHTRAELRSGLKSMLQDNVRSMDPWAWIAPTLWQLITVWGQKKPTPAKFSTATA